MSRCAVTFLWGCSSGILRESGQFEVSGTPWNYMVSGCPCLVAALWDVTDKDIDLFSKMTLNYLGLGPDSDPSGKSLTVPQAVAKARKACNMKYLNGAAPVVYGIPTRFSRE